MKRSIAPSAIYGQVKAPPSKSMTQRAIAAATLAEGQSTILYPSFCNDSLSAIRIAAGLGASIESSADRIIITGGGKLKEKVLDCGESGLAIRMFSPIASLFPEEIILTGTGSLRKRPMFIIGDALAQLGVRCISKDGFLPLTIQGPLKGGRCEIDGSLSSQVLTGLLMSLPLTYNNSEIKARDLKSKPYIDMTIRLLSDFGIQVSNDNYKAFIIPGKQKYFPRIYEVEGDWSGGAFLLVAGAIAGNLSVNGLCTDSPQSDKAIINALIKANADIRIEKNRIDISKSDLKAFEFDATESPDLFPPLVALASYCSGKTKLKGATRLLHKESNRAYTLAREFQKMNIPLEINDDHIYITGGRICKATIDSHGDHRIAMAAAVAALGASGPVTVEDSDCVSKSYPGFYNDLMKIGVEINE